MIILHNNYINTVVFYPCVYPAQQKNDFERVGYFFCRKLMYFSCLLLNNSTYKTNNETAMQFMKQQITLQNHQFSSVQSTIPPLLHTAKTLFWWFFNYSLTSKILLLLTNAVSYVQISRTYRLTEQQRNGHTWWGWFWIVVVVPPTMRPSSLGFILVRGTPEVLRTILIKNSIIYISAINIKRASKLFMFFFLLFMYFQFQ